jgi:hypothetical protein
MAWMRPGIPLARTRAVTFACIVIISLVVFVRDIEKTIAPYRLSNAKGDVIVHPGSEAAFEPMFYAFVTFITLIVLTHLAFRAYERFIGYEEKRQSSPKLFNRPR